MIKDKELIEIITEIIKQQLNIGASDEVQEEDLLQEEYGLDSIKFVKIIILLEEKFDFEFEDEDLLINKFQTINSIKDVIKKRL